MGKARVCYRIRIVGILGVHIPQISRKGQNFEISKLIYMWVWSNRGQLAATCALKKTLPLSSPGGGLGIFRSFS